MSDIAVYNKLRDIITKKFREIDSNEKIHDIEDIEKIISLDESKWSTIVRSEDFIGRTEQLGAVNNAIKDNKKIIQIMGIDGIGKSELCRHIFCEYADLYEKAEDKDNALMPIYMQYEFNLDDSVMRIVNIKEEMKYSDCVDKVWKYLVKLSIKKKLLIFIEGVNKSLAEDETLNKLFALNCTSIVTTVDNIYPNSQELCKIRLGSLSDEEAVNLFKLTYDSCLYDKDEEDILYIVKELADNHSLTIKILASAAKAKKWEVGDLLRFLEDYDFKMSAVFLYSEDLEILIEEYKKLLTIMNFSEIEKSILEAFSLLPYDDYSVKFCVDWMQQDCDVYDFGIIIDNLCETGWLDRDDDMQYSMNGVVATVIRHVYNPKIENHLHLVKMCDKYLQLYALNINDEKHTYWRIAENIVNEMYEENVHSLGQLAMRAGKIFDNRNEYERARSLYRRAVVIYENVFGREHIETSNAYCNLALTYEKCKDYNNALLHYNVALEIQESVFNGKEQEYTGNTYANMAGIYTKKGKYEKAVQYYGKGLEIKEKLNGRDNLDVAQIYGDIANVLYNMGDNNKALTYYNTAVSIRIKVCEKDDVTTAQLYTSIAHIYRRLSMFMDAIKYFKKAIEIYERAYGKEHLLISYAYNGMAGSYARMGKQDKALQCSNKSIEMCEHLFGNKSMAIATAYNTMALVCKLNKEYETSKKYFTLALNIVEKILGNDNIYSAQVYKGMAGVLRCEKKYEEALEYYEKAIVIRREVLGKEHPDTVDIVNKADNIKKMIEASKVIRIAKVLEESNL